jgi:uncharacterized RDD family membrane protein YckC
MNDLLKVSMANPWRRLGAMLYDALLCAALLMVAAVPFLPFNGEGHQLHGTVLYTQRLWLLCVLVVFFVFFWSRKGKTLGMQAWSIWIQTEGSNKPSVQESLARLLWACIPWLPSYIVLSINSVVHNLILNRAGLALLILVPLNYLTAYLDPRRRAFHDRFLKTQIVFRPK